MSQAKSASIMDSRILIPAVGAAFTKLNPRALAKNPVMFVVATVSALTTVLFLRDLVSGNGNLAFSFQINLWLWFTVLFANFAEAVAEGRGKAQADSLRKARTETQAKLLTANNGTGYRMVPGTSLKVGDLVLVEAGDIIPRTAKSSKVWPRSTKRPSPANPPRSFVNPAATARPSPAARRFFPTGSASASPRRPAPPSSTA